MKALRVEAGYSANHEGDDVGLGGGLLLEDGFTGPCFRGGGGLEWLLSHRVALRATGQAGYHGGQNGPHLLQFGIDYRW
jgi:hypothetical protein